MTALGAAVERLGHLCDDLARRILGVGEVGGAEQQRQIAGVDRRGLHAEEHLVAGGRGEFGGSDVHGQRAVGREGGEKLLAGGGHGGGSSSG